MRFVALLCFLVLAAWASLGWKSAAEQRPPEGAFPATVSIVWDFSAIEPATLGGSAEWTSHLALAPSGQARALACLPPKDITFDAKPDEKACLEQAEVFVSSLSEDVALIPGRGSIAATCWRWPEGWVRCDPGDEWQRAFPLMEGDQVYKERLTVKDAAGEAQEVELQFLVVVHKRASNTIEAKTPGNR